MTKTVEVDLNGKRTIELTVEEEIPIPATTGVAVRLRAGRYFRITDPNGKQPADFWAFNAASVCKRCRSSAARCADQ